MRKIAFILVVILISQLFISCSVQNKNQYEFYYCNSEYQYGIQDGVIASESRTFPIDSANYDALINEYLSGPSNSTLTSPFPDGTKLHSFTVNNGVAEMVLTQEFSQLKNADLTIACACLTLTISHMISCKSVEISAVESLLNNRASIKMDVDSLINQDIAR